MNQKAYYGEFGGQYVAESLMNTLEELDKAFPLLFKTVCGTRDTSLLCGTSQ